MNPAAGDLPGAPVGGRQRTAHWLAQIGLFCLPALVLTVPINLLPYGLLLLASTLLAPELLWRARHMGGQPVKVLTWLMLAVLALGLLSVLLFEQGLRDVDNRSRFVVIPWIALWVCALRPDLRWLWRGALAGLLVTFAMSLWQVLQGAPRAELFTNAIVLADIVMVLMVLLVFCRPSRRWSLVIVGMAAGCGTIVLTGSRGVFAALLALLVVLALSLRWRTGTARLSVLAGMLAIGATLLLSVPELRHQVRLSELHSDMQRMEQGDSDSSAGARVERLQVAWDTFLDHPLVGVGIGHFDDAMQRVPVCRENPDEQRCHLGHAHNDVAEWAATQGMPGLLLLLAVYGVPLWVFVRLHRRSGRSTFRGPAAAGIMIVTTYVLCGLTQSMFAHQMTASFYVTIVGLLAGLSILEGARHRGANAG
ncbi:O-antigen ligase family protein [Stenotrophomonas maltophilia]|uniref:O-antigen ligase family protein n=1 Tax=Stenotrophomonas maltophilia TaxID=40324 RepID=UPI0006AC6318|nr:polymerase [Stenotrophomonas maltophilia]MBA0222962.1 O-antigen ligase family protein [Stenotrophomonas maltophilia]MBH1836443.1 O-antigen ligase family protein [Stenotrophomonas maltophilia]MCU1022380.1 O-antigen ligase family protein [Stenotrophomonas maltophilia]MCU1093333.1 O-antigen ligase family protein [Stenotrophomonas maltophilia]